MADPDIDFTQIKDIFNEFIDYSFCMFYNIGN